MNTSEYAKKTLDALIDLDKKTTAAYYDMGRLLAVIKDSKLYVELGYDYLKDLIEEELSFTPSSAHAYMRTYKQFTRLNYHRTEALNMMNQFGMTHMCKVLPKLSTKIGVRAMKNRVAELQDNQMTFWMNDKQKNEIQRALRLMGAMFNDDTERWTGSSEALLAMAREVNAKPKVKRVA